MGTWPGASAVRCMGWCGLGSDTEVKERLRLSKGLMEDITFAVVFLRSLVMVRL